jgi:lipoprotein-anchoring transpeptidase ErfK/SrfK
MRLFRNHTLLCAAALSISVCAATPALAQGPIAEDAVMMLKPGQFVWDDAAARAGNVTVVVSIASQRAFVYRGGTLIGATAVSTGAPGHETPTGEFTILQKQVMHKSNLYNEAPMPFMQRLTWDGIAIHAGRDPGHPDSHGCVRVPIAFAKKLFGMTRLGAKVTVTDEPILVPGSDALLADPNPTPDAPVTASGTDGGMIDPAPALASAR